MRRYLLKMSDADPGSRQPSRKGCIVALALIPVPGMIAFLLGHLPGQSWPFALFNGVFLAVPFGYLALEGTKAWLPWVVATALSSCFWGALIADAHISAREGTGSDFSVGLIIIVLSPLVTTTGAWMAVQFTNRPSA